MLICYFVMYRYCACLELDRDPGFIKWQAFIMNAKFMALPSLNPCTLV